MLYVTREEAREKKTSDAKEIEYLLTKYYFETLDKARNLNHHIPHDVTFISDATGSF